VTIKNTENCCRNKRAIIFSKFIVKFFLLECYQNKNFGKPSGVKMYK